MGKFKKGEIVYYASMNCGEYKTGNHSTTLCMVIERTVESCGNKQMTFYDNGSDSTFGRTIYMNWSSDYFKTADEAFAYLNEKAKPYTSAHGSHDYEIHESVEKDNCDWYNACIKWKTEKVE